MNKITRIKDFHAERAKGVGSSDIPALAGLYRNYGSTTLRLWQQKTGRAERWEGNDRTDIGRDLEAYVLYRFVKKAEGDEFAQKFYMNKLRGRSTKNYLANTECRHPERRYCIAHADLVVDEGEPPEGEEDQSYLVEAKVTGYFAGKRRAGETFTGYDPDDLTEQGIPDAVFLQVQWQQYCYGVRKAYVAVMIDTGSLLIYGPIIANPRVQEKCLALAERFWRHVENDTTPAPETWEDVQALFPNQTDTTAMIAGDEEAHVREMIKRDKEVMARIKTLEAEREDIKNAVGILIGGNAVLSNAEGEVLAKAGWQERETVTVLTEANKIKKAQQKKKPPVLTERDASILQLAAKIEKLELVSISKFKVMRY